MFFIGLILFLIAIDIAMISSSLCSIASDLKEIKDIMRWNK